MTFKKCEHLKSVILMLVISTVLADYLGLGSRAMESPQNFHNNSNTRRNKLNSAKSGGSASTNLAGLNDTGSVTGAGAVHADQLCLYRQKMQLSLIFLGDVLTRLRSIQQNMKHLLITSADPAFNSISSYGHTTDALEKQLAHVEDQVAGQRSILDKYSVAYRNLEEKWNILQSGLLSQINSTLPNSATSVRPTLLINLTSSLSPKNVLTACGGTLRSDSGSIAYKLGQKLSSYENCVWAVSAKTRNFDHMTLTIRDMQFPASSRTFVSVGYFNFSEEQDADRFSWKRFELCETYIAKEIPRKVAFIQFFSSSPEGRTNQGFQLDFQASRRPHSATSYNDHPSNNNKYNNVFLKGDHGSQRYPLRGKYYASKERTSIVVQPTLVNSTLSITSWNTEVGFDVLGIWSWGKDFRWKNRDRLSGEKNNSEAVRRYANYNSRRRDPFILIFRSDGGNEKAGFEFSWGSEA